jgi:23S rRNA pseudouridine2605 synthase
MAEGEIKKPRAARPRRATPFRRPQKTSSAKPAFNAPAAQNRDEKDEVELASFAISPELVKKGKAAKDKAAMAASEKLHKVLADAGIGSRRDMEELILQGRVSVNGEPAYVGQRVLPQDIVRINGRVVRRAQKTGDVPRVLIYHKPAGEIVTTDDPEGRTTVFERLPRISGGRWIAVGRLDLNTEGLLLFSNNGALVNRLMHPRYELEREYCVRVQGTLADADKEKLISGITLEDGPANFQEVEDLGGAGSNHWYKVLIKEGRNREVRRMFEAVNLNVSRLIRVRYGDVNLPKSLPRGKILEMKPEQVEGLLSALNMTEASLKDAPKKAAPKGGAKAGVRAGAKPASRGGKPGAKQGGRAGDKNGNTRRGENTEGAKKRSGGRGRDFIPDPMQSTVNYIAAGDGMGGRGRRPKTAGRRKF